MGNNTRPAYYQAPKHKKYEDGRRRYQPIIHLETKPNAEVWLRDNTDLEIGQDLVGLGLKVSF